MATQVILSVYRALWEKQPDFVYINITVDGDMSQYVGLYAYGMAYCIVEDTTRVLLN